VMDSDNFHVTIIVPAYNEQERIAETLYGIKDYLSQQSYSSDIITIDDGSHDLTSEIVRVVDIYSEEIKEQSAGELVQNFKNVGKGYSVAKGLLIAKGDIIVFTDADASTPINEIKKLINKIHAGNDVVIGTRNLPESRVENRPVLRSLTSKLFNKTARVIGLVSVSDSQCGFKAYRREAARAIAQHQKTFGYCFDVEHIYTAKKLGYSVAEVPVSWRHDTRSTLSLVSDSMKMFLDLLKIRWIHRNLQ